MFDSIKKTLLEVLKSFILIPKLQLLLQSSSGPFTYDNEIKLYLTGSHCHNFQLLYNRIGLLCKNQEKKAHSISPKGNIFLGKKYDYPILGSEIQAIIFCVMSKTCCKTFSFSILCTELYWVLAFCSKHAPKQHNSISVKPTVYRLEQWARSYS